MVDRPEPAVPLAQLLGQHGRPARSGSWHPGAPCGRRGGGPGSLQYQTTTAAPSQPIARDILAPAPRVAAPLVTTMPTPEPDWCQRLAIAFGLDARPGRRRVPRGCRRFACRTHGGWHPARARRRPRPRNRRAGRRPAGGRPSALRRLPALRAGLHRVRRPGAALAGAHQGRAQLQLRARAASSSGSGAAPASSATSASSRTPACSARTRCRAATACPNEAIVLDPKTQGAGGRTRTGARLPALPAGVPVGDDDVRRGAGRRRRSAPVQRRSRSAWRRARRRRCSTCAGAISTARCRCGRRVAAGRVYDQAQLHAAATGVRR